MKKFIGLLLLLSIVLTGIVYWRQQSKYPPVSNEPFELFFWYWNSQPPGKPLMEQTTEDIRAFFLLSGELRWKKDQGLRRVSGIKPSRTDHFGTEPLHLTYHLNVQNATNFLNIDISQFTPAFLSLVKNDISRYREAGRTVKGIQLDYEVPTSQLAKFGQFVSSVKSGLGSNLELSITTLHTWIESQWFWNNDFKKLVEVVDFFAPKLFGKIVPRKMPEKWDQFSAKQFRKRLAYYTPYKDKVVIGLPIYGQWMAYQQGRLQRIESRRAPGNLQNTEPIGKQSYRLEVGGEEVILVLSPTTEFKKALDFLRSTGFRKLSFFRYVGPSDYLTLAPNTVINEVKQVDQTPVELFVKKLEEDIYRAYVKFESSLINKRLQPKIVQIRLDKGRFIKVAPGDFEGVDPVLGVGENYMKGSLRRANALQFKRQYIQPGRPYLSGPILFEQFDKNASLWLSYDLNERNGLEGLIKEKEHPLNEYIQ